MCARPSKTTVLAAVVGAAWTEMAQMFAVTSAVLEMFGSCRGSRLALAP
jgi:hypothetical protein